ncbi:MAG: ion transporter [Alphaproteobacteria bacterium]|nr:ion transporter [Alphaproteobacteria bacterium]
MEISEEREKAVKVVEGVNFDCLIMFLICMDAVVLGLLTVGFGDLQFRRVLFLLDRLCMAIFIFEMLVKMYAYGRSFFSSGWNIFDLSVITISAIPIASCMIILRTFRLFRTLRYINRFRPLKNVISVMLLILPSFLAMTVVLSVFAYVFGIMGVVMFGDEVVAFSDLSSSIFTLIQAFTFDGWASTIVRPMMRIYPYSWIYFYSFMMISFLLAVSFVLSAISVIMRRDFKIYTRF